MSKWCKLANRAPQNGRPIKYSSWLTEVSWATGSQRLWPHTRLSWFTRRHRKMPLEKLSQKTGIRPFSCGGFTDSDLLWSWSQGRATWSLLVGGSCRHYKGKDTQKWQFTPSLLCTGKGQNQPFRLKTEKSDKKEASIQLLRSLFPWNLTPAVRLSL